MCLAKALFSAGIRKAQANNNEHSPFEKNTLHKATPLVKPLH